MTEKTLAILKPDTVVVPGRSGLVLELIELNGFKILEMVKKTITKKEAQEFYAIHKDRPFYDELCSYMSSAPVIILALEKENAIEDWRNMMGATNPANAGICTLRKMFGKSIGENGFHGSDAKETAKEEVKFFFKNL